jgi:Bacterial nucleoid DNA-binding protein
MTKVDLITIIADKLKFPSARAELLVEQIFSSMSEALMRGEGIEVRGFGSFQVRSYRAYKGRNPRTGQVVAVRPRRLPISRWARSSQRESTTALRRSWRQREQRREHRRSGYT